MINKIRHNEELFIRLFSEEKTFSENLIKWEDKLLPDKYDQNFFEYLSQPTKEEFDKALKYQKDIGANFIKLEGREPLDNSFNLEDSVTLTMVLESDKTNWTINPDITFKKPSIEELEELEVKHFASIYGEDFTRRNIHHQYKKLNYLGAYLDKKLVGACYSFSKDGLTCIDGLIVDEGYRRKYIATSLINHIKDINPGTTLYLHADEDDTPKDMYKKMGFDVVDKLYEYLSTDIMK